MNTDPEQIRTEIDAVLTQLPSVDPDIPTSPVSISMRSAVGWRKRTRSWSMRWNRWRRAEIERDAARPG